MPHHTARAGHAFQISPGKTVDRKSTGLTIYPMYDSIGRIEECHLEEATLPVMEQGKQTNAYVHENNGTEERKERRMERIYAYR